MINETTKQQIFLIDGTCTPKTSDGCILGGVYEEDDEYFCRECLYGY